jgi:hypothetical protein
MAPTASTSCRRELPDFDGKIVEPAEVPHTARERLGLVRGFRHGDTGQRFVFRQAWNAVNEIRDKFDHLEDIRKLAEYVSGFFAP